ncbi:TonB family protein [Flavihumibacter sp. CACIAM 22H1]|uniref:TonB family protein n=1 Tax=Flavihumibacter sp. CACIAM 22H1 TaxID=1812911 RepID=UPI0007A832BF|nr:TonB family protein [Flavihumibacter sp. CACIAM 22H1]KYP16364.1 MAG: hypothetical protein A1D16_17025 [Flavihumibacter sp. CACIAM 22H1]
MRSILLFLLSGLAINGFSQQDSTGLPRTTKSYFTGFFERVPAQKKGAEFVELVKTTPDSMIHVEIRHVSLDQIVLDAFFDKKEPVGIWYYHLNSGGKILNYDFPLVYGSAAPDSIEKALFIPDSLAIINYLMSVPEKEYLAPEFATGDADLAGFMQNNLVFPYYSMVNQETGRVLVGLQIDEAGNISKIAVENGVNTLLDKEAMRIMKKIRFKSGARYKGQPVRLYYRLYISFYL